MLAKFLALRPKFSIFIPSKSRVHARKISSSREFFSSIGLSSFFVHYRVRLFSQSAIFRSSTCHLFSQSANFRMPFLSCGHMIEDHATRHARDRTSDVLDFHVGQSEKKLPTLTTFLGPFMRHSYLTKRTAMDSAQTSWGNECSSTVARASRGPGTFEVEEFTLQEIRTSTYQNLGPLQNKSKI